MQVTDLIRARRTAGGLSQAEMAARCGMTVSAYADIEQHADEVYTAVPVGAVKQLCAALGIGIDEIVKCGPFAGDWRGLEQQRLTHEVATLRAQRLAAGLSIADVAEAIGFEESVVLSGEVDRAYLDSLPVDVLAAWAKAIGVGVDALLI